MNREAVKYVEWFRQKFPNPRASCTPSDHEALAWLMETQAIESVFEIGTWEGYTSLFFWLYPTVTQVTTIDICEDYGHPFHQPGDTVRYGKYTKNTPIEFEKTSSWDYDLFRFCMAPHYNLIFIDGNHNYDYVKNDWELALKFNPKVIVLHDYENAESGVDMLITALKKKIKIEVYPKSSIAYHITEKENNGRAERT
jgi:hypothetical protein